MAIIHFNNKGISVLMLASATSDRIPTFNKKKITEQKVIEKVAEKRRKVRGGGNISKSEYMKYRLFTHV